MAKTEWGMKRLCPNCGTRYYDMRRDPIVCPHCGSPFDPEALLKTRRTRATAAPVAAEPVAEEEIEPDLGAEEVPEPIEPEVALPGEAEAEEEEEEAEEAEAEEEEEEVLEDASELGEDEDDMAEVIENVDEEDE